MFEDVPGSEDVESKAELIALLKAHDAAAVVNANVAAAAAAAKNNNSSNNSNNDNSNHSNTSSALSANAPSSSSNSTTASNERTIRFANADMDLEELDDLDKVVDDDDKPQQRQSDTDAATIATLEPLDDDDLLAPPPVLPAKKTRDSYSVSATATTSSSGGGGAGGADSPTISAPANVGPEKPTQPRALHNTASRPAPMPVSRSTPVAGRVGGGRALPTPSRGGNPSAGSPAANSNPPPSTSGAPTTAPAAVTAAGAPASTGSRKLPQRPAVGAGAGAAVSANPSPAPSPVDRVGAPERTNSAPHRAAGATATPPPGSSSGSGVAAKPAVLVSSASAAVSSGSSKPVAVDRPAFNRSQPRKMSSVTPPDKSVLTSSDGAAIDLTSSSEVAGTPPSSTTPAPTSVTPSPSPAPGSTAAAAPAARSKASTTEVGTKVWLSDHRYIFSINNTIPVASATEKTFTAYLVQVLDVDTGEEASILRRYRQFEHLHDKISAMYPKKLVPKFTEKKRFGMGNLSQEFIQKRCEKLQKYLNLVSELPNVFEFPPMVEFLETDLKSLGTKTETPPPASAPPTAVKPPNRTTTTASTASEGARSPPLSPRLTKSPPLSPRVTPAATGASKPLPAMTSIAKPAADDSPISPISPKRAQSTAFSTAEKPSVAASVGGVLQKVGSAIRDEQDKARIKYQQERQQRAADADRAAKQAAASNTRTGLEQLPKEEKARALATMKEAKQEGGFELHLSGFGVSLLPEQVYQDFEITLQVIGIEFNAFTVFPDLSPFRALIEVRLGGNQIHSLNMLKMMGSLRILLLNGNQLSALGDEIGELTNLQRLDVANNHISSVSSAIGKLTALEELNMSGNLIETLPSEIGQCGSLEIVDINGCALQKLPNDFTYLTRVMELNVGNNNLTELPQDIGRMTRLCSLNVADNALKNLPMSVGLCQSLDNLGAGFNIERNPIEDEKMIARYQVGTDHLCQYLANRLQAWEQNQVSLGKPKEVLSQWRGPIKGGHAASQGSSSSSSQHSSGGGGGGSGSGVRDVRASVRRPDTEADKITVLCSWAGRELQSRVKVRLREMRDQLTGTDDMSIAAPIAKNIRSLRQEVDKFCSLMPPITKTPAPDMSGISDKLQLLKLIISPIVADIERIIDAVQMELDVCDSSAQAVNFVKITKAICAQLTD